MNDSNSPLAKIGSLLESQGREELRTLCRKLLAPHFAPVFGAAKSIEHEVAAYEVLKKLGFLSTDADEYDLVMALRVTKAKARSLVYQSELRRLHDTAELDDELRKLIANPILDTGNSKETFWLLEVPNPLLMDALRSRIRKLHFVTDGSFSPSLARIPRRVFPALIEDLTDPTQREKLMLAFRERRQESEEQLSLQGLLEGMLIKLGEKAAGEAGAVFGKEAGEALCDLMKRGTMRVLDFLA